MASISSEVYGEPLPEVVPTILERFLENVDKTPDALALIATHQPADIFSISSISLENDEYRQQPYLRWTYKALKSGVDRLTLALRAKGVKPGTPLVCFLQNTAEFVLTFWAANQLGCVLAPINPRNFSNKEEVSHMLKTVSLSAGHQPMVLIAGTAKLAEEMDLLPDIQAGLKIVVSDSGKDGWTLFQDLMKQDVPNAAVETQGETCDNIFFTSGTTSLPKGCRWTAHSISTFVIQMSLKTNIIPGAGEKFCIVVPNNHAIGMLCLTWTFCCGGAVVFPGPAFAPDTMISAFSQEKCTFLSLVPTMVHSLLEVESAPGPVLESLKTIFLGGSLCTPEVLRHCMEDLGSSGVENGWGMTEGVYIGTGNQSDLSKIIKGDDVSVGRVLTGSGLKICGPGQTEPLARGEAGELHASCRTMCNGYIGKESTDFYTDSQGRRWFKTGDQAVIDDDGRVFIVGRYKEMIIRGAENIAPAAIETVLGQVPRLAALQIQIIGAPDAIAGEVPVAIVHGSLNPEIKREILDTIIKRMGTIYIPDEVISLEALGLQDYPRTMAGKIQKAKLAELVRRNRSDREKASNGLGHHLGNTVREIWAQAIGREPHDLSLDDQISEFADSILLMRIRDKIKRETGKSISLADMVGASTLAEQIKILEAQSVEVKTPEQRLPKRSGPPGPEDMVHLVEDPELFDATRDVIGKAIEPYGLGWNDVVEVMPVYDFSDVMIKTGIFESWNTKMVWQTNERTDESQLRTALELLLKNHPLLASFLVSGGDALELDTALHVIVKHDQKFLDQVIEDAGSVKTLKDLDALCSTYPQPNHARYPGPLFRALIYYVEEIDSCAVLLNVNHAVVDASYGQIYAEDFDNALSKGKAQLHSHIDYKLWADSYYSLRSSPAAKAAIKWHVRRLKDLDKHRGAIFPPIPQRRPWDIAVSDTAGEDLFSYSFEATGLLQFRKQNPNITPPVAMKSALVLVNTHLTGHTHALFSNLEAARTTFPFVPKVMESQFEATDVAGPTIQTVLNFVEVKNEEKVIDFLLRMQDDQINLTKHASAPLKELVSALGKTGDVIPIVTQAQVFNWIPTAFSNPHSNFKSTKMAVSSQVGMAVNCGLSGKDNSTMFFLIRGDAMDVQGYEKVGYDLEKVFKWLLAEKNWTRSVGEFVECLGA